MHSRLCIAVALLGRNFVSEVPRVRRVGKTLLGRAMGALRLGPVLTVNRVATTPATEVGQTASLVLPLVSILLSLVCSKTVRGSPSSLSAICWGYSSRSRAVSISS